jgi:tetratricopeptide (TPR) repeat protein
MTRRGFSLAIVGLTAITCLPFGALSQSKPLPPLAGASESAARQRAALFEALANAKNEAEARDIEDRLWTFWRSFADDASQGLLEASKEAQLRFDYGRALGALEELVKHQPDFAEGWNQLAYVLFLAGSYEASLKALDQTLSLEPMHYAALAGKGIILTQQGKEADAQLPLLQALAINPWLKERNLIVKDER